MSEVEIVQAYGERIVQQAKQRLASGEASEAAAHERPRAPGED